MKYWLDLFTGKSWSEFRKAGARVSGFRPRTRGTVAKVQPGDVFLCYLVGVQRWVGALEIVGPSSSKEKIWTDDEFPVRLEVKPLIMLDAENGIPMDQLEGKVHFFQGDADKGKYRGFVRGSPNPFKSQKDGDFILGLLREAEWHPVTRPVDEKKLAHVYRVKRKVGKKEVQASVTIPERSEDEKEVSEPVTGLTHSEIQWELLTLGAELGLQVWVARNDRSKVWNGQTLGDLPGMVKELPTQFDEATNRTVELIDVLWLKRKAIVAAFEVEHTSAIYSGLLRMSDLLSLQPNLDIKLYLVAPDEKREKVKSEILRPTFRVREKPLPGVCGFVAYSKLTEYTGQIRRLKLASKLNPSFLEDIAEYFTGEE